MIIENKNGRFYVSTCQYNFLRFKSLDIDFNKIDRELTQKTSFINTSYDYDTKIIKEQWFKKYKR